MNTHRPLTQHEAASLYVERRCPFCGASTDLLIDGPRGAAARNYTCGGCLARFNLLAKERWGDWPTWRSGAVIEEPSR